MIRKVIGFRVYFIIFVYAFSTYGVGITAGAAEIKCTRYKISKIFHWRSATARLMGNSPMIQFTSNLG